MIRIGLLGPDDASELFAALERSHALHEPWMTPPGSEEEVRDSLDAPADVRLSYGVREETGQLAGVININAIIRGAFLNGFLGYYALSPYEARGYMHAGLASVLERAFREHGLHRVEANVQPGNARSARLVQGLGFRLEGHSPRYLRLGDEWRDHDRYALTVEEWGTPRSAAQEARRSGSGTAG
jgi:ribosomal-protein-alanine N-acetyltransferase